MIRASSLARWPSVVTFLLLFAVAGCSSMGTADAEPRIVLVAGATGGTGRALVNSLTADGYAVRALVRDEKKARAVLGDSISYAVGDVRNVDTLVDAMQGATYVISAIGSTRSDPSNNPESVDYGGVSNMATAAAQTGVKPFVLVSSSGVTHEDHFLNKAFDNVLNWKFKGENALRDSGVPYTIVRPGGLVNTPGGEQALVFSQGDTAAGRISREDFALICIAALNQPAAINKTFETFSSEKPGTNDWATLFAALEPDPAR